jgi:hypothetical protein
MRRILAAWLIATLLATTGFATADEAAAEDRDDAATPAETSPGEPAAEPDDSPPPPAADPSPPAVEEPPAAAPVAEPAFPPAQPAADGTTSVIVPPPAAPPANSPPPAEPFTAAAPATPPPEAAVPPPPETFAPPPPSESAALLASLLEPPSDPAASGQFPGRPTPLIEPLVRSGDRSRRLWIVQAYWKVTAGQAAVRSAATALERLELVAPGGDPHDRATLDVATAAARADLADARARLNTAQQELADLARLPFGEPPPWTVDLPLADPYQTYFEAIFANRLATGRVRAIVRSLPARHEAVAARATAATAAAKALDMAEADHARGKRPIEAVVAAHAAVVGQETAFIEAVRTYNLEIAEYAMGVADLSFPDEQFVSMLIAAPTPWRPQPIEPVSATVFPPPPASPPPTVTFPPPLTGLPPN